MRSDRVIWLIHSIINGISSFLQFDCYYFALHTSYKMEHMNLMRNKGYLFSALVQKSSE